MPDIDPHDEIERLEAQIENLAARIENCRKFILAGRMAVAVVSCLWRFCSARSGSICS
jgi:cob(I)alamin adenosyltransferase